MTNSNQTPNRLINETSPYLLQHAYNPVDWYPWGDEAFAKAKAEDKPVFLSIGYSTCHWCHVMAHESFESAEVAGILNENFVPVKVDREQRPDIDSVYMEACQAFTGSGGWPTSIFMTPEQKPFFAGTYFPKTSRRGMTGFIELLNKIDDNWHYNRENLTKPGDDVISALNLQTKPEGDISTEIFKNSAAVFTRLFDAEHGGFGRAPKFPTPHNLIFLLQYYQYSKDAGILNMVEKTLTQMYRGGIFDHIGGGFSRYSTDRFFLAPHFEKMLYDNALLSICCLLTFNETKNEIYKKAAIKTMDYVMREMTGDDGRLFCAQDADSDGVEGKYYVFTPDEIINVLGEQAGEEFNRCYDITEEGNFEGKNIPNLLKNSDFKNAPEYELARLYEYRKTRTNLHIDDKTLTSWSSLMIAAYAYAYRILGDRKYFNATISACRFIETHLAENDTLYASWRNGKHSGGGFLSDYAFYIYALINMYEATYEQLYLDRAAALNEKAISDFYDARDGGFFLYGVNNEQLIIRPKETYDGAIPSGNSVMAYNLIKLAMLTGDKKLDELADKQIKFMSPYAAEYPAGYSFYLTALSMRLLPHKNIVCVLADADDIDKLLLNSTVSVLRQPTNEYPLKDGRTTFYVCENHTCLPPTNEV